MINHFPLSLERLSQIGALVCCAAIGEGQAVSACGDFPDSATVSVDALIERAGRIVLATVPRDVPEAELPESAGAPGESVDLDSELRKVLEARVENDNRNAPAMRLVRLKIAEVLKGPPGDYIYQAARTLAAGSAQGDFDAHRAGTFWNDPSAGRSGFDVHCRAATQFEPGNTYLVFSGPFHVKGYELIENEDDRWLAHVREYLQQ